MVRRHVEARLLETDAGFKPYLDLLLRAMQLSLENGRLVLRGSHAGDGAHGGAAHAGVCDWACCQAAIAPSQALGCTCAVTLTWRCARSSTADNAALPSSSDAGKAKALELLEEHRKRVAEQPSEARRRSASRGQTARTGVLFTGQRPALTDPVFLAAASELAQFDVLQPQASMTRCAQQAQLMDQTIPLLCGRKHEQQRLLSNKQAAAYKVETELASLLGWLAPGAAGYYGFAQLPAELKLQVQDIAERPERWIVVAICLGAYHFYLECTGTETPQSVTAAQLITMLRSCTSEAHRATEELRYIRDERALFKLYCRARWRPLGRPPQPYSCGGPRCWSSAPCWRAARSARAATVAARRRRLLQLH